MCTATTALLLALSSLSATVHAARGGAAAAWPFQIQVGNAAYVLYPNQTGQRMLPDQSTLVLNFTSSLRGYQAWTSTLIIVDGPSLSSLIAPPYHNVTDTWDVEAAIVDASNASIAHAFIHREHGWDPSGPDSYHYNGYVTYAVSNDAGYSFVPYPATGNLNDTIIVTSAGPPDIGGPNNTGTGPHWAVTVTDPTTGQAYIQLIVQDYYAVDDATGAHVTAFTLARSRMEDGGRPGTWLKWYNGSWSTPGIGGQASAIPGLGGAKMVWVDSAQVWVAVGYSGQLFWSADPQGVTGWGPVPSNLFPALPPSPPSFYTFPNAKYYQSLIPGWGGTVWHQSQGDSLNLFYAFIAACNGTWGTASRGLASAQLTFLPRNTSAVPGAPVTIAPYTLLPLAQYLLKSNSSVGNGGPTVDKWATVWPVDQRVYDYGWFMAYLLASLDDWAVVGGDWPASSPPGLLPLLDCYLPATNDHFTGRPGECGPVSAPAGEEQGMVGPVFTPTGRLSSQPVAYLGPLGYVLASNTTGVPGGYSPMALWRCYDPVNQDHYLAPLYGCQPGDEDPTLLGYVLWHND